MIAPYFLENFWVSGAFNLCFLHRYYCLMVLSRCSIFTIFVSAGKATVIAGVEVVGRFVDVAITVLPGSLTFSMPTGLRLFSTAIFILLPWDFGPL